MTKVIPSILAFATIVAMVTAAHPNEFLAANVIDQPATNSGLKLQDNILRSSRGLGQDGAIRAVVRSFETAAIASEVNARITYLPAREGDRFKKGDLLVEFDCSRIDAEFDAANANFRAHSAQYENQKNMLAYKAAGNLAVEQAKFETERAAADVRAAEVKRLGCKIFAPFDGRLTEKLLQIHELAQPNQPLIKIINDTKIELVLMVPSSWLQQIEEGMLFTFAVDETGETHQSRIMQSTGIIDPVSQSARLIAELVEPSPSVLPGMSGTAVFKLQEVRR